MSDRPLFILCASYALADEARRFGVVGVLENRVWDDFLFGRGRDHGRTATVSLDVPNAFVLCHLEQAVSPAGRPAWRITRLEKQRARVAS